MLPQLLSIPRAGAAGAHPHHPREEPHGAPALPPPPPPPTSQGAAGCPLLRHLLENISPARLTRRRPSGGQRRSAAEGEVWENASRRTDVTIGSGTASCWGQSRPPAPCPRRGRGTPPVPALLPGTAHLCSPLSLPSPGSARSRRGFRHPVQSARGQGARRHHPAIVPLGSQPSRTAAPAPGTARAPCGGEGVRALRVRPGTLQTGNSTCGFPTGGQPGVYPTGRRRSERGPAVTPQQPT